MLQELHHLVDEEIYFLTRAPKRESKERVYPLLVGIASGLLVGAVVALLFTPRTGREFRSRLAGRATGPIGQIAERATAARRRIQARIRSWTGTASTQAEHASPENKKAGLPAKVQALRNELMTRVREAIEAGKAAAREKAAEERARYRELTNRPDALSDPEEPTEP